MKKTDVADFLQATSAVEGWLFPVDAYAFGMLDEIQKQEGIAGNLFEVGVHHGKTAIFLARAAAPQEIVGVCDVFASQELFLGNMRSHTTLPPERLAIFAKRSAALTTDETTSRVRFFHIDGGHRPEDVFADLLTADRALLPDGVVSLDDVFNPNWPGVGEGFYNFLAAHPGVFVPVFIGGNKVFFTRPDAASRYERHWAEDGSWSNFFEPGAFTFDYRDWLGRRVLTAIRTDPKRMGRIWRALRGQ